MDEEEYRAGVVNIQKKYGDKPCNRFAERPSPQPKHHDPGLVLRARQRYEQYQAEKREAARVAEE